MGTSGTTSQTGVMRSSRCTAPRTWTTLPPCASCSRHWARSLRGASSSSPFTRARLAALSWEPRGEGLSLIDPVPYVEMLSLVTGSDLVITDSGGLQEETSFLGIPCLTVRPTTERPITCSQGTNRLVAARREAIEQAAAELWGRRRIPPPAIERWDGRAAE